MNGTYIGIEFDQDTVERLDTLCEILGFKSVEKNSYHTLLIYSKNESKQFRIDQGSGKNKLNVTTKGNVEVYNPKGTKLLILIYTCVEITNRISYIKSRYPELDCISFIPCIILRNNIGNTIFNPVIVEDFKIKIELEYEYYKRSFGDWLTLFKNDIAFLRCGPVDVTQPDTYDDKLPDITINGFTSLSINDIYNYFEALDIEIINGVCLRIRYTTCNDCDVFMNGKSYRCLDCNTCICSNCCNPEEKFNHPCTQHRLLTFNIINCNDLVCGFCNTKNYIGEWLINKGNSICGDCDSSNENGWDSYDPFPLLFETGMESLLEWIPILKEESSQNIILYNVCPSSINYHCIGYVIDKVMGLEPPI